MDKVDTVIRADGAALHTRNILIVSDFNAQNLASLLSNWSANGARLRATAAPFGQVMQLLLAAHSAVWQADLDAAVVWTSPQAISNAYAGVLAYEPLVLEQMMEEVRAYARALAAIPPHVKSILVPTWTPTRAFEGRRGLLDMHPTIGPSATLMRMNLALAEAVSGDPRIHLFDAARWIAQAGTRACDARMWYLAKIPFSLEVFKSAARDLSAALTGIAGGARKLVILDLDDTLWGGVVGDVGWRALRLGGHDAVGEAFRDFQLALKALARRGVLLAIASKNEERTALEAIANHPEMVLKLDDFAGWRIDWNDKARNIAELVAELNLGLDAAVLIDDHPVERARVAEALPALLVPQWPQNPLEFASALRALDCFDAPAVSAEDRERGAMYLSERRRKQLQQTVPSLDAWLATLELRVQVEELSAANLERAAQLLNKTNQMNLRTRRLPASEMLAWASAPDRRVLVFRVADRFGDYGLVGIGSLSLDRPAATANIEDFVLSCRVMGRRIEEAMLHTLAAQARRAGSSSLRAGYLPTARNQPCLRFFCGSGMTETSGDSTESRVFDWSLDRDYPLPGCVSLANDAADWPAIDQAARPPLAHRHIRPATQAVD